MSTELKKAINEIEKSEEFKKMPREVRAVIKETLEYAGLVKIPIITHQENGWIIASTPIIDVCAQGKTEEEAISNLKAMIEDYMTDPYTKKPEIGTILKMQVSIKSVPVKFPFYQRDVLDAG